jgi:DNA-binding HxlR family transcriptional regulator
MGILTGVFFFACAVITHALLSRAQSGVGTVRRFFLIGLGYGIILVLWAILSGAYSIASVLVYAFGCELYIFVFTLAANSVSLGIVVRLLDGPAPISELSVVYSTVNMVERRLMQLEASGLISRSVVGWQISPKGVTIVRAFGRLRKFFRQTRDESRIHPCAD